MDHSENGHYEELSHVGIALIKTCGCGLVHLGIGPVTVKLTKDAFGQVAESVEEARERLASDGRVTELPVLALVEGCVQ